MDVEFAGVTALEIIRRVRCAGNLSLSPVPAIDVSRFSSPRGSLSGVNFLQLGLTSAPSKEHPAWIRVPNAANRKRTPTIRCLTFPKQLPDAALMQLGYRNRPGSEEPPRQSGHGSTTWGDPSFPHHDRPSGKTPTEAATNKSFATWHVFVDSAPLACLAVAASYQRLISAGRMAEGAAVIRLVELLMELVGHYGRDPANPSLGEVQENLPAFTSLGEIRRFVDSTTHVLGVGLLRIALRYARDGSRSPMETCLWIVLTLPQKYGLFELGGARLNAAIVPTSAQRALMRHRTLTPDILWEAKGTALEYQGFNEHSSRSAHVEDNRRLNDYQVCGIRAHFVTFNEVRTRAALDALALEIAESMRRRGYGEELRRVRQLLEDDEAAIERARHLAHLLPPVRRD